MRGDRMSLKRDLKWLLQSLLAAGLGLWLTACGQTIEFKVTRIGTLPANPNHPAAVARARVLGLAEQMLAVTGELQRVTGARGDDLAARWERECRAVVRALAGPPAGAPVTVLKVREQLDKLKALVVQMRPDTPAVLQDLIDPSPTPTDPQKRGLRGSIPELLAAIKQTSIDAEANVKTATAAARFGGFVDNSVYRVDAASGDYAQLEREANGATFSRLFVSATGETATMLVQESPAQFTQRGVSADPTEAIRNTLIITNKILRVVSSFLPLLGVPNLVGGAVGGVGTGGGSTTPAPAAGAPPEDPATAADSLAAAELAKLANDPLVIEIRSLIRSGQAVPAEKQAELAARVSAALAGVK